MSALPALAEWESFYLITGGAAAGFTGLMFVVISLTSERSMVSGTDALNAFATPSVVHFSVVLLIASLLSVPGQTAASLAICMGACGVFGLVYSTHVIVRSRRQRDYAPEASDWLWYLLLPLVAYACLLASAVILRGHLELGLHMIGAVALMLLYAGIHNAWDSAMWVALKLHNRPPAAKPEPASDAAEVKTG